MNRAPQLGAHLEKLYEGGAVELPEIAGLLDSAGAGFSTLFFSYAMGRDSHLGMWATGPSTELAEFGSTMRAATVGAYHDVTDVAHDLTATAQALARTDSDVRKAFLTLGGKLT